MSERQGQLHELSEHELSEIRMMIEEPDSIGITIADSLSVADAWNVEILATDVGRHSLKHAERGIYKGRSIGSVSERQLTNHFTEASGGYQVRPRLRKMVSFAQM